jgi:hypothetical protein
MDCDLTFNLKKGTDYAPWQEPKAAKREALRQIVRTFCYACGFALTIVGVYLL